MPTTPTSLKKLPKRELFRIKGRRNNVSKSSPKQSGRWRKLGSSISKSSLGGIETETAVMDSIVDQGLAASRRRRRDGILVSDDQLVDLSQELAQEKVVDGVRKRREGIVVFDEALTQLMYLEEANNSSSLLNKAALNFQNFVVETLSHRNRQMAILTLQESIRDAMHQDYTEIWMEHAAHGLEANLIAADHLIEEFIAVQDSIQKTVLPASLQEVIFDVLQEYLQPRIADLYSLMSDVTPQDAVKIMNWIDEFLERIETVCPLLEPMPSWWLDAERLFEQYLERGVRREMRELLQQVLQQQQTSSDEQDIRKDADGNLVTGYPDQIGYLVEVQLSVARELLPEPLTERVLHVINQELFVMVSELMLKIEASWKSISSSRFCAIVNDTSRLSEMIDDRNQSILTTAKYVEVGDDLSRELVEVSLLATKYLCQHVLQSLREPEAILTSIGDNKWEADTTGSTMERTVATLKDYFSDLEKWLISDYFFPKVLKNCFDLVLETYVSSFFSNTMSRGVRDAEQVSNQLEQDFLTLLLFFRGDLLSPYHGLAGFYTQNEIHSRLCILHNLAVVLDPLMSPEEILPEIKSIMVQFANGGNAEPAILHLAGLRKRYTPQEGIVWLKTISQVRKEISSEENQQTTRLAVGLKVPDLRNSRFIRYVSTRPKDVQRQLSMTSRQAVEITQRLVGSRAPTKFGLLLNANKRIISSVWARR